MLFYFLLAGFLFIGMCVTELEVFSWGKINLLKSNRPRSDETNYDSSQVHARQPC